MAKDIPHSRKPTPKPDRTKPPTAADLELLPRWARVAFAARCARRVYPIIESVSPRSPEPMIRGIQEAIVAAESWAKAGKREDWPVPRPTMGINASANSAMEAAFAAYAEDTVSAVDLADEACITDPRARAASIRAMWHDLDRLRDLAVGGKWDDVSPVPESFFAEPLWPFQLETLKQTSGGTDAILPVRRESVPTEKDLESLPRWAKVAFAARCARRVQPLFQSYWPGAPKEHTKTIERAISDAEGSARVGRATISTLEAARSARDVADAAFAHVGAYFNLGDAVLVSAAYAAAATAASAATAATTDIVDAGVNVAVVDTAKAAVAAVKGASADLSSVSADAARDTVMTAMWHDVNRLQALAEAGAWTNETPVPASFFDEPLWPYGVPEAWPLSEHSQPSNTNRTEPPKEADLQGLPRWAVVAFAARSAEIALGVARYLLGRKANSYWSIAQQAIAVARASAQSASLTASKAAANVAAYSADTEEVRFVLAAANAAANSASHSSIKAVQTSAAYALSNALNIDPGGEHNRNEVINALWRTLDRLRELATGGKWTDETPVPASFFDEHLWPTPPGPPPGWPGGEPDTTSALKGQIIGTLGFIWDPSVIKPDEYQAFITALGDLARAHGASGIVRIDQHGISAPVPAEVYA